MSIIHRFLASAFGTPESRVLMVGLDASGRTTMLYRWKLGEVVTTIPTIGFNVEQVTHKKHSFTFWDVGGCDKIRPLWRHYFANTQFVIFVVDSNDRERMEEVEWSLGLMTCEDELRDTAFAIALNKQDLPNAMGVEEVTERLKLRALRNRVWKCFPCSAIKGEGIYEILEWMAAQAEGRGKDNATAPKPPAPAPAPARERSLLEDWLEVEDEPDDEFLKKLAECTLDSWDHRTHLRIAWVLLERHGRREGMRLIFEGIKNFIDHSPHTKRSRGTTFHETMTYFWVHMVHYAMAATRNPTGDFKGFLVMNPQLSNGGMFLDYYRKETMLNNPEARTQVVLPDLKPLPSILSDVSGRGAGGAGGAGPAPRAPEAPAEVSDAAFMEAFEGRRLRSWGHEALIRVIAANLLARGRREGSKQTFAQLEAFMGEEGYHCTLTYFWIQMVDFAIARLLRRGKQPLCFRDVWEAAPELRNDRLPQEHYRSETLFSKGAAKSMVLPDLKPLPSIL